MPPPATTLFFAICSSFVFVSSDYTSFDVEKVVRFQGVTNFYTTFTDEKSPTNLKLNTREGSRERALRNCEHSGLHPMRQIAGNVKNVCIDVLKTRKTRRNESHAQAQSEVVPGYGPARAFIYDATLGTD